MTQISDIITAALRETNIIAVNASPTPSEETEALIRLQALILSALGSEAGYIMEDWNISSSSVIRRPSGVLLSSTQASAWTVPPNARLIFNLSGTLTITLDRQPQDGQRLALIDAANTFDSGNLTVNPNGRKFNGSVGNAVISTENYAEQYFYDASSADWKLIDPLADTDPMPFPADFDDYFITMLAMRMNPRYGMTLTEESKARMVQQEQQFIARYAQTRLRNQTSGYSAGNRAGSGG